MKALRSRRAWIPAAVASLTLTVGLVVLQAISHYAFDDVAAPARRSVSFLDWSGHTYIAFFGPDAFDMHAGRTPLASLASLGVLLVLGFLGCWWAVRGIAPGSSIVPPFLSIWMVLVVTTTLAAFAGFSVLHGDRFGSDPMGAALTGVLTTGAVFGVKWGWIASLLASMFWLVVRPRAQRGGQAEVDQDPASDRDGRPDPWHNERPDTEPDDPEDDRVADHDNHRADERGDDRVDETQPIGRPVQEGAGRRDTPPG